MAAMGFPTLKIREVWIVVIVLSCSYRAGDSKTSAPSRGEIAGLVLLASTVMAIGRVPSPGANPDARASGGTKFENRSDFISHPFRSSAAESHAAGGAAASAETLPHVVRGFSTLAQGARRTGWRRLRGI
jgi:hypothetical protein